MYYFFIVEYIVSHIVMYCKFENSINCNVQTYPPGDAVQYIFLFHGARKETKSSRAFHINCTHSYY